MSASLHMVAGSLISLGLLGAIGGPTSVMAQSVTVEETVHSVRRMLERLPYYGVFDYIVFRVEGGTVYLANYSFEGRLKGDAEVAAKRASGVVEVANKIEVLPASPNDDRIRWATLDRIRPPRPVFEVRGFQRGSTCRPMSSVTPRPLDCAPCPTARFQADSSSASSSVLQRLRAPADSY